MRWDLVDKTGECWLWQGAVNHDGYAMDSDKRRVHRLTYEALVGPIPPGLVLDHLCRVRHCVRPDHLEPVTQAENLARGRTLAAANAAKTHCGRGHELAGDNLTTQVGRKGKIWRGCRECKRMTDRARRAMGQRIVDPEGEAA